MLCNLLVTVMAMQDLRLKATNANGDSYDTETCCYLYRPKKQAITAISTHLRQLTCLDLSDAYAHELGTELKALSSLKQLRMLGLEEKSGPLGAASAVRKQRELPGPLGVKDVQQWLTQPDDGW